jgi:hypothetical protein
MSDPVPAVAETAATGAIAEIFADIRQVLRVEVVNLIWRHLATLPDALPWTWRVVRPFYANGTIAAEAAALRSRLALPHLPPFPPALLAAVGSLDLAITTALATARSQAAGLAARFDAPPLDPTAGAAIRAAIEPFAGEVIPGWSSSAPCCGRRPVRWQRPETGRPHETGCCDTGHRCGRRRRSGGAPCIRAGHRSAGLVFKNKSQREGRVRGYHGQAAITRYHPKMRPHIVLSSCVCRHHSGDLGTV